MKKIRFLQTGIPDYDNRTFAYISGLSEDLVDYYSCIKKDFLNIKAKTTFFFNSEMPDYLEPKMDVREISDEEYNFFINMYSFFSLIIIINRIISRITIIIIVII